MAAADAPRGTVPGLLRAFGSVLGVHIQYAQREAKTDMGRVLTGVVILVVAGLFAIFAVLFGHVALVYRLAPLPQLGMAGAIGAVAAGDLALALLLGALGRRLLRRPVLSQTRDLVKRTVESFADA